MFRTLPFLGVVVALLAWTGPASAAKGVKKTGEHHVRGTVVAVDHKGKDKSVTVHVHHKKKKGQNVAGKGHTRTFQIDQKTKVETVRQHKAHHASLAALHKGEHVMILAHNHHADRIIIHHHKKKAA